MCPITFLKLNNGNLIGDILHDDCTSCKIFISTKRMKFLITVHARIYFFFPFFSFTVTSYHFTGNNATFYGSPIHGKKYNCAS